MQAERWKKVEELYQAAMALPPEKRAEFLSEACREDAELREEVRSLLAQDTDSFLESGPVSAVKALNAGARLGHFEIVGLIGRGGMGEVYRARDTLLKRDVAIKSCRRRWRAILTASLASSGKRGQRARSTTPISSRSTRRGARATPGGSPRNWWPANRWRRRWSAGRWRWGGPSRSRGKSRMASRRRASEDSSTLVPTGDGTIVGTAGYMSPEQVRGEEVDQRSDLFSFGVILYEMLAGKRAFTGGSSVEVMHAILKEEPGELPSSAPPAIAAIVRHCLDKLPERRFQSALDLGYALRLAVAAHPQVDERRKRRRWPLVASALLVVTLAAAGSVYWRLRPERYSEDLRSVPLMPWPGSAYSPTFSPDGNKVAFDWNSEKEDTFHIYVTQIGSGARPVQLTNSPAPDSCPAWSPDDRYIAFMRFARNDSALMLAPSVGGPERKVADFPWVGGPERMGGFWWVATCPSWTPDSKWLAISTRDSPQDPFAIWLFSAATGERRRLTQPPAGHSGELSAAFSPDGRALAFFREIAGSSFALYLLPLSHDFRPEREPWQPTKERYGIPGGIAWTTDGRDIVYSDYPSGLLRLSVSGHHAPTRAPYASQGIEPAISPARQRLVYVRYPFDTNLWRMDTRTGERKALALSGAGSNLPQFSPDGRKIAFQSNRSGETAIWTCDADGANCLQLTSLGNAVGGSPRWSPDSQRIAFDWGVTGHSKIYVMQADGGRQRRLTNDPTEESIPSWSHDGRWIYFASDRTGRSEVWKIPAAGGAAAQVTHDGGGPAFESVDGEYLYYYKTNPSDRGLAAAPLFRVAVSGGSETQVLPRIAGWTNFSVAAKAIYFTPDGKSLQRLDLACGKVSTVITPVEMGLGLSVSPDEAYVVWAQYGRGTADLMLVEGFR